MRLEHHLVGGYVHYISPHLLFIISCSYGTLCVDNGFLIKFHKNNFLIWIHYYMFSRMFVWNKLFRAYLNKLFLSSFEHKNTGMLHYQVFHYLHRSMGILENNLKSMRNNSQKVNILHK